MTKLVDISTFDAVSESEQPYDLVMQNTDGTDTPVTLCILGQYSSAVEKWNGEFIRKYQREMEMAKRKGKDIEAKSYEEMRAQDIDGTLIRIVGWKGVAGDYDRDKMQNALLRNPHWRKQIQDASEDTSNFMKPA